jgi:hypothetical protein
MGRHLLYNGFTKDYTMWIYHGEAHCMREEEVRPRLEACDDDAGVVDMLEDAHQALFNDTMIRRRWRRRQSCSTR